MDEKEIIKQKAFEDSDETEGVVPPTYNIHNIKRRTYSRKDLEDTADDLKKSAPEVFGKAETITLEFPSVKQKAKPDALKIILALVVSVALLMGVILGFVVNRALNRGDYITELDKDYALGNMMASGVIHLDYNDRNVCVEDHNTFYDLLQAKSWTSLGGITEEDYKGTEKLVRFVIDPNYGISVYKNATAIIKYGSAERCYSMPYSVVSDVERYLDENTLIDADRLEELLSEADELIVTENGERPLSLRDTSSLVLRMNVKSWTAEESSNIPQDASSAFDITDGQYLRISFYTDLKAVRVRFNGNTMFYSISSFLAEDISFKIRDIYDNAA